MKVIGVWTRWYARKTEGGNTVLIRVRDDGYVKTKPKHLFTHTKANDVEKIYQENFGESMILNGEGK